jgi:anaerobic magnesium-protoporphyrin IX monomethyl ester cyclase
MKVALAVSAMPTPNLPLGLAQLAGYARSRIPDLDIRIFDGTLTPDLADAIIHFNPDVVGVSAMTPQAKTAYKLLDTLRAEGMFTVMGGVHASALPDEALRHADTVVVGEGEKAFTDLLMNPHKGIIQGDYVQDLDSLPLPAYDLLDMGAYTAHAAPLIMPMDAVPSISLMTSRGCRYRCPFCYNSTRKTPVRYRSAESIINELTFLKEKYGIHSVFFQDDEFLGNEKRLRLFTWLLKKTGLANSLVWGCCARVDTISLVSAFLAKQAGCVSIFIGFESAVQKTLNYLKRGTVTVKQAEETIGICNHVGLRVGGSLIFGIPGETLKEMKQTLKWAKHYRHSGKLAYVGYNVLMPYPGTETWKLLKNPEQVNYDWMMLSPVPQQRLMVNETVPFEEFSRFMQSITERSLLGKVFHGLWRAKS